MGFAGGGWPLHGRLHDRRNVRLRSITRTRPPRTCRRRDMRWLTALCALLAVAGPVDQGIAADPRYPDWPCAQAKVPEVSLAAVWNGPALDEAASRWKDNAKVSALVPRLAARRTPLDEEEKMTANFLSHSVDKKTERGKLFFASLFDTLNAQ